MAALSKVLFRVGFCEKKRLKRKKKLYKFEIELIYSHILTSFLGLIFFSEPQSWMMPIHILYVFSQLEKQRAGFLDRGIMYPI